MGYLMDRTPFCNYYGQLDRELLGDNIGIYIVDEAFTRLLEKYKQHLIEEQAKIIKDLHRTFKKDIEEFKMSVQSLSDRFVKMEKELCIKKKKEEKKNAKQKVQLKDDESIKAS